MSKRTSARQRERSSPRLRSLGVIALTAVVAVSLIGLWRWDRAALPRTPPPASAPHKIATPFADVLPILAARPGAVPPDLRSTSPADLEAAWPVWASQHDAAIRARIHRGEEDSVVNLWLYGTTFTTQPRVTTGNLETLSQDDVARIIGGRLDDLLTAVTTPGTNERLQSARQVLSRQGIDPATPAGRERAWNYLDTVKARMAAEEASYAEARHRAGTADRALLVNATLYDTRGLSSDTGMPVGFSIERTLADLAGSQLLAAPVRRVAIVGPGLDFTDKAEGYDFYPPQSIQPFALVDSLIRLGLARMGDLEITTLDISARVTGHLSAARDRAGAGHSYVLHVPLDMDSRSRRWQPALVDYWQRFGDRLGDTAAADVPPAMLGHVRVRTVAVRPDVVRTVVPRDVNIVVERLNPAAIGERFDLVIATNVLLYYDAFEQALALSNISSMLRPGGLLVTSDSVTPVAPMDTRPARTTIVERDYQGGRDILFAYRRH